MTSAAKTIPLDHQPLDAECAAQRAQDFAQNMARRRTVRNFAPDKVDRSLIENAIAAAGSAPSGANQQPWHFVAISDTATKRAIRLAAEEEERAFYSGKAGQEWLDALMPLGTDDQKPFLEIAPWLIVVFAQRHGVDPLTGDGIKHYYVNESVGIACGLMLTSLHLSGLVTLTHTPSPMGFLREICGRPAHEKPLMIIVAGHPAKEARVPAIERKKLADISSFIDQQADH